MTFSVDNDAVQDELAHRRKKKRIMLYLEISGLGDLKLSSTVRNGLLAHISEDYDRHPDMFRDVESMIENARRYWELLK